MEVLWRSPRQFLRVRDVVAALDGQVAHTTVMTLLVRLYKKGLLERRREGRAYGYRPLITRSEYVALRMLESLEDAGDLTGALLRFVGELNEEQQAALRAVLEGRDP